MHHVARNQLGATSLLRHRSTNMDTTIATMSIIHTITALIHTITKNTILTSTEDAVTTPRPTTATATEDVAATPTRMPRASCRKPQLVAEARNAATVSPSSPLTRP